LWTEWSLRADLERGARADEENFAMSLRVDRPGEWQIIHPTTQWQWMKAPLTKDEFLVATELYNVDENKQ
jgi:hypothetical protein